MYDSIDVTVSGSAATTFTHAEFRADVTTYGKTGPEARGAAKPVIEAIRAVIVRYANVAKVETDRVRTTFAVGLHRRYDAPTHGQVVDGYRAVYTASFRALNVAEAGDLHDALTSIPGVESPTPIFHMDRTLGIYTAAFTEAAVLARARFLSECEAIGVVPSAFEVVGWRVEDDRPSGKMARMSEGEGVLGVDPGRAVLDLCVTFSYRRVGRS
jgi:uncharacterized protein YggE